MVSVPFVTGACPLFVTVTVYPTAPPGVTVVTLAELTIVSTETSTVLAHRGSALPAMQLFPAADDVTALAKTLSPLSRLFSVTENVTVTVSPADRSPVHVTFGLAYDTDPALAAASPL